MDRFLENKLKPMNEVKKTKTIFFSSQIGNALVCLAVYTNHSMRTVTNIFIVNLAVADFFVILLCLPPTVVWDVTETWFLGETLCKVVIYFQVRVNVSVISKLLPLSPRSLYTGAFVYVRENHNRLLERSCQKKAPERNVAENCEAADPIKQMFTILARRV